MVVWVLLLLCVVFRLLAVGGSCVASSLCDRCMVVRVWLLLCVVFRLLAAWWFWCCFFFVWSSGCSLHGGSSIASCLCGLPAPRYREVLILLLRCVIFRLLATGWFWCCLFFVWSSVCSLQGGSGVTSSLCGLPAASCMEALVLPLLCVVFRLLAGGSFWCCFFFVWSCGCSLHGGSGVAFSLCSLPGARCREFLVLLLL